MGLKDSSDEDLVVVGVAPKVHCKLNQRQPLGSELGLAFGL